jgi:HlyD family secretion protein
MSSGEPVGKVAAFPQPAAPVEPMLPAGSDFGLKRRLIAGLIVAGFLVFGVGSWAAIATLSGAVIASGLIVVDSNSKKVQHPSGGVVGEILVKNGDAVAANDVLLRLDDTQTRAALGIVVSQLVELIGRKARLMAERDDAPEIEFPADFASIAPDAGRVAAGERRLFEARRKTTAGQKAQHRERIEQLRHEVTGLSSQRDAKARELGLIREELARLTDMYRRNLLPVTRVLAMQREEARIDGEHGALVAQIARASGQIGEIELQILLIDQTLQSDAQKELREIEGRIAELSERRVAAEDQLKRIDLRAPIGGTVHELSIYTVGGVIAQGETLMLIVPNDDRLVIEVRVSPVDIDQLKLGQPSVLRFPAFNLRTTPEVHGKVTRISADLTREAQTGQSFYVARVQADEAALATLGRKLVPGMPVEAFIETGQRTALSYLVKPFTDQLARAFKER